MINPKEIIPFCLKYNSVTDCSTCQPGYFRESGKVCKRVGTISFCKSYSQTAAETLCLQCSDLYFLISKNSCQKRQNLVDFCSTFSVTKDQCTACDSKRHLSNDFLACLTEIPKCDIYKDNDKSTTSLICIQCQNGYFLNEVTGLCDEGNVANCLKYNRVENECVECVNGFYLTNLNTCLAHQ